MDDLVKIARTLFCAKRKVKLLGLALLIFSAQVRAGTTYGPYIVKESARWLPDYIEAALMAHGYGGMDIDFVRPGHRRRVEIYREIKLLAQDFRHNYLGKIEFRAGGDKKFDLPGRPPRMAVTGTAIDSKVIFNLGLIADPKKFGFGDALGLWIHELGHKLEPLKFTQVEIDDAASAVTKIYADHMRVYEVGGMELLVLNPVPFGQEGDMYAGPDARKGKPVNALFAVLNGPEFTDLTEQLNLEFDRFGYSNSNKIEIKRVITEIFQLKTTEKEIELRLEMRTSRMPKNLNRYAADEIGPNFHKSARVVLSRDLKKIEVSRYVDEPLPRPLIRDAEAELLEPRFSTDRRRRLEFTLKIHLKNQTHFHAAGYPETYFVVHALLDGEPIRLEAKIRYRLDESIGGMPGDVYQKAVTKVGRVSVDVSELRGQDLELIGIQDRFFTLGRGYEGGPEQEQKRVPVRAVLAVKLPACEFSLRP